MQNNARMLELSAAIKEALDVYESVYLCRIRLNRLIEMWKCPTEKGCELRRKSLSEKGEMATAKKRSDTELMRLREGFIEIANIMGDPSEVQHEEWQATRDLIVEELDRLNLILQANS